MTHFTSFKGWHRAGEATPARRQNLSFEGSQTQLSEIEQIKEKVERWAEFLFNDFRSIGLFFCISQDLYVTLAERYALSREDSKTENGVVLNPSDAGQCLTELKRTEAFVRGLDAAVKQKLEQGGGPVRVLYAGCGPFATLALPLTFRYQPEQLQFTLLDYHRQAIDSARDLFRVLGKEKYLKRTEVADAVTYSVPTGVEYDICLTETLQRALTQECQVPIVQNLLRQLPESTVLLPQEIRVSGLWTELPGGSENRAARTDRDVELGMVVRLNADTARQDDFVRSIPARRPATDSQVFCLQTEIDVYDTWGLKRNESGLTCPHPLGVPSFEQGETLRFKYATGKHPGLRLVQDSAQSPTAG